MDILELVVTREISASHSLPGCGKCARTHGHNYGVTVRIAAPEASVGDMLVDAAHIKGLIDVFDHRDLGELLAFPSAENIARAIAQDVGVALEAYCPDGGPFDVLVSVRETEDVTVTLTRRFG